MKASKLILELQKQMALMNCDPDVVIQHPNDDAFNNRDVYCGKRGLHAGYIGMEPVIFLDHAYTLLGEEMPQQIWRRFPELERYLEE